ncbi:MAG: glycosyltransferase [Raineya sp.]|nr:glycosyltransferase [Raineya sp.]
MSKHILYISYDGLTDPLGQSQILPYLMGLNRQYGYTFSVISAEKADNYQSKHETISKLIDGCGINWQPVFYTKKPPVLSTLWDLRKIWKKAIQIYKQKPYEIVHARSYLSALIALRLKNKLKTKFIFDMRGFWADERIDGGLWNLKSPLYNKIYLYFKKKEKEFLQKADYTISLTHNAKQEIQSWQGFEKTPIQVIPCCVDLEIFKPSLNVIPKSKNLTISYLGSIGTWYLLKEMLLFYKYLLEKYPDAIFSFITAENPQPILEEAKNLNLPLAQIKIRKASRHEVPLMLAESHFSLFFIKDAYSKKASSATKMAEILAMGIPIITNDIGDHQFLASQYNFGCLLKNLDVHSIQKSINQIPNLLNLPPESLIHIAQDYFSLEKGVESYASVYQKI